MKSKLLIVFLAITSLAVLCSPSMAILGQVIFVRGDVNQDKTVGTADLAALISYFQGSPIPCRDAADVNGDGHLDISDLVFLSAYLYQGGNQPPQPFPSCGWQDPVLGCAHEICP